MIADLPSSLFIGLNLSHCNFSLGVSQPVQGPECTFLCVSVPTWPPTHPQSLCPLGQDKSLKVIWSKCPCDRWRY